LIEWNEGAQIMCTIIGASRCGLFDKLQTIHTKEEICTWYPYPDSIPSLLSVLEKAGLVTNTLQGYQNTELATCYYSLTSPYSQIPYLEKVVEHIKDLWLNIPDILLHGPRIYDEQEFFAAHSLPSMAANSLTGRLQAVTNAVAALPRFSQARSLVDLGGGHGLYALALAYLNRDLTAVVYDLPGVIPLTQTYIAKYQMEKQVSTLGGNFFEDEIGTGYDIILSSSNPSGKTIEFLPKITHALNPGGYYINIQPGDPDTVQDPCNKLEWELWTFSGEKNPKSGWEKNKRFFTPEYHGALLSAGLSICSVTHIPDPYIKGYYVTMIITEKLMS
jgi:hypothetical protein